MNNRKCIFYLFAGILAVIAVHLYLSFGGGEKLRVRTTALDRSMLQADGIVIERTGAPVVRLGNIDGEWRIFEPYVSKAASGAVARILDSLVLYKIVESYSDNYLAKAAKRRSDFGLADPVVKIRVTKGRDRACVHLGDRTPDGGGVFAVIEGDAMTYVLDRRVLEFSDIPSDELRSRELSERESSPVHMFDVKRAQGSLMRFSRKNGQWMLRADREGFADSPASNARIDEFLNALSKAEARSFIWPVGASNEPSVVTAPLLAGYGLDSESGITITIRDKGLPPSQIVFGNEAGAGLVYALVRNSAAVVTVDGRLKDMALESDFSDSRLFPGEPSRVSRIAITDNGVDYLLAKNADGDWVMDSPVVAPADEKGVSLLLDRILAATVAERDMDGLAVSLATNAPVERISRGVLPAGFSFAALRSRKIATFEPSDIRRIVSEPGAGLPGSSVLFDKDRRTWIVENSESGSSVRQDAVATILDELRSLDAVSVVTLKATDAELARFGLDDPAYTVSVDFFKENSIRRNVFIGERTSTGYYATMGAAFDAVFILSDESVARLTTPLLGR